VFGSDEPLNPTATGSRTAPLLSLRGISRTFEVPVTRTVLRDVDLDVPPGKIITIVGRSGAGKSTLLNILGLLDRPTSGQYWIGGQDVAQASVRRLDAIRAFGFGFVFQEFVLIEEYSVIDNIATGLLAQGATSVRRSRERAARLAERVGLADLLVAEASRLSGGERQRVAVARALIGSPSVLLCDEPTGNLDSKTEASVMELLQSVVQDGVALIVATHNPQIAALGDLRISIDDGLVRHE